MSRPDPTGTLIYTHGTGTRKAAFDKDWSQFKLMAHDYGFDDVKLVPCDWGSVYRTGIPDPKLVRSVIPGEELLSQADAQARLLLRDPLFELRLAGMFAMETPATKTSAGSVQAALSHGSWDGLAPVGVPPRTLTAACRLVANSDELAAAEVAVPPASPGQVRRAAARAALALARSRSYRWGGSAYPDISRPTVSDDDPIGELAETIGGDDATPPPWADALEGFARGAAWPRDCSTQRAAEFFADVFWYVRSSQVIAGELAREVRTAQTRPPVVLVAHSLGGIAAIDLLSNPRRARDLKVDMLVTFGTQAGLVFAMDAMRYFRLREPVAPPDPVPFWLNFHGSGDLLSFKIAPLTELAVDHDDVPVDFTKMFPGSHGEYITLDLFWHRIRAYWPLARG